MLLFKEIIIGNILYHKIFFAIQYNNYVFTLFGEYVFRIQYLVLQISFFDSGKIILCKFAKANLNSSLHKYKRKYNRYNSYDFWKTNILK